MAEQRFSAGYQTNQGIFSVQDFRNVEISQIKALASVLYNEDLVSEEEHWGLCFLMKAEIDQIWDDLEQVIRAGSRRSSPEESQEVNEPPKARPKKAEVKAVEKIDDDKELFSTHCILELELIEHYVRDNLGQKILDPELMLLLIRIIKEKINYYGHKYDFKLVQMTLTLSRMALTSSAMWTRKPERRCPMKKEATISKN